MVSPHDRPTLAEMVEAVRTWIEGDLVRATDSGLRFHARVAANMLAIVERELAIGPVLDAAHRERLESLGVVDDADLVAAIRSGRLDDRASEVRALVWASVRDKLLVANPAYLGADVNEAATS